MKILLRNQRTKLYYAGGNEWRSEPDCAIEFSSSLSAWKLVLRRHFGDDLEIVYLFGGREEAFSVTIEPPQRGWS